jgi:predicted nuclease of predicted toxin-antitoxin system
MQQNNLEFWIDVNLPPAMAKWIQEDFGIAAKSFKELNFDTEKDEVIFTIAAERFNTIISTTKDIDFKNFAEEISIHPRILYLNIGNVSNKILKEIVYKSLNEVIRIFSETDDTFIEITKKP